uniref:F-box domain-containing protein n=1 Tax=Glossina pallidipes TaxID=7398 RepID=A0A1B0AAQ3_GLOPL
MCPIFTSSWQIKWRRSCLQSKLRHHAHPVNPVVKLPSGESRNITLPTQARQLQVIINMLFEFRTMLVIRCNGVTSNDIYGQNVLTADLILKKHVHGTLNDYDDDYDGDETATENNIYHILRRPKYAVMDTLSNIDDNGTLLPVLPYEMWAEIFGYLSHASLQQVKLVCKEWYEWAHAPALKRKSKLIIRKSNLNDIEDIMEHRKDFSDYLTYESVQVLDGIRGYFHCGEHEDDFEEHNLARLVKVFRHLGARILELTINNVLIFSLIQDYLPMLKVLDLYNMQDKKGWHAENIVDVNKLQNVESLWLPFDYCYACDQFLYATKTPFKCLKELTITMNEETLDGALRFLKAHAPSLRWLALSIDKSVHPLQDSTKWTETFKKFSELDTLYLDGFHHKEDLAQIILDTLYDIGSRPTTLEKQCGLYVSTGIVCTALFGGIALKVIVSLPNVRKRVYDVCVKLVNNSSWNSTSTIKKLTTRCNIRTIKAWKVFIKLTSIT